MQQQIGLSCLLQGRFETGNQIVRQVPNKANSIAQQNWPPLRQVPAPRSCIQRREKFILCQNIRVRQAVHQSTLAGIGIPDQRTGHRAFARTNLTFLSLFDFLQFVLQVVDTFFDQPAIRLQLLFTRTTHTDAHLQTGQVSPHSL